MPNGHTQVAAAGHEKGETETPHAVRKGATAGQHLQSPKNAPRGPSTFRRPPEYPRRHATACQVFARLRGWPRDVIQLVCERGRSALRRLAGPPYRPG